MDTEEEKSLDRFVGEAIRPFMGLMVQEIEAILNISLKRNDKGQLQKSALEQLMKKIFGVQKMGGNNVNTLEWFLDSPARGRSYPESLIKKNKRGPGNHRPDLVCFL